VHLAKPALDLGLYTHAREPMLEFWQQRAGVAFEELLPLGGGVQQHRHRIPDGNHVELVSPGTDGITQLEIRVAVRSLDAHRHFYEQVMRLDRIDADRFRCGESILALDEDPLVSPDPALAGAGYRYITVQVHDVRSEHATILERGGREGRAPVRFGEVAYISFVRDPDGNWIEISQRESLTGSLD
jgi:lactoylglutathione lyase